MKTLTKVAISLPLLFAIGAGSVQAQKDLEDYLARIRETRMSEGAWEAVGMVSHMLTGVWILTVRKLESGVYSFVFHPSMCYKPGSDRERFEELVAERHTQVEQENLKLRPYADLDDSGFVTSDEAVRFRDAMLLAFRISLMEPEDRSSAESAREATGLSLEEFQSQIGTYREVREAMSIEDRWSLPELPPDS